MSNMALHFSSASPEHYTPRVIIDRVLRCWPAGIDLDPCSNAHGDDANVPARIHYTKDDGGLSRSWRGRVYMNPPYGRAIREWVGTLVFEYEHGDVREAIALLPGRIDTRWMHLLRDYLRCEVRGRLIFGGNTGPAPFPSVVVYLGRDRAAFIDAFSDIGDIWERVR